MSKPRYVDEEPCQMTGTGLSHMLAEKLKDVDGFIAADTDMAVAADPLQGAGRDISYDDGITENQAIGNVLIIRPFKGPYKAFEGAF